MRASTIARFGDRPYVSGMREQILKLLADQPFVPFVVDVAEDVAYAIPTRDHVWAGRFALVIEDDRGYVDIIPYRHIRRLRHAAEDRTLTA